ncbi:MAG: class F sortase [Bacillota bacterium]|nr:MAG: class F sortase [Bacillota bacterium]
MRKTTSLALATVLAAAAVLAACGSDDPAPQPQSAPATATPAPTPRPELHTTSSAVADPARIRIPSIGVDAQIVPVGLTPNGHMETPSFGLAGWYSPKPQPGQAPAPRPGEVGPAVIAGHVDGRSRPDVFYRLKELTKGAKIIIVDKKGKIYEFAVERKRRTPKTELPVEEIWSATKEPTLRLITCGGEFDRATGHYTDNWTVFATAVRAA